MDKFDETLGKVAQALADATNKYGPDVAEYIVKTVHYDAIQFFMWHIIGACASIILIVHFRKFLNHINDTKNYYDDRALAKGFAVILITVSWGLLAIAITTSFNIYQYEALLGDPKITLTKNIISNLEK